MPPKTPKSSSWPALTTSRFLQYGLFGGVVVGFALLLPAAGPEAWLQILSLTALAVWLAALGFTVRRLEAANGHFVFIRHTVEVALLLTVLSVQLVWMAFAASPGYRFPLAFTVICVTVVGARTLSLSWRLR